MQTGTIANQATGIAVAPATSVSDAISLVMTENQEVLAQLKAAEIEAFLHRLDVADRIFVEGEGRSGLAIRMFAMRLMHLGKTVYVVGETITPSIRAGNLLVAISGSGTTQTVCDIALKARQTGAGVTAVTTAPEAMLARTADQAVITSTLMKEGCCESAKSRITSEENRLERNRNGG